VHNKKIKKKTPKDDRGCESRKERERELPLAVKLH
jgi:hypothetical protein